MCCPTSLVPIYRSDLEYSMDSNVYCVGSTRCFEERRLAKFVAHVRSLLMEGGVKR